MAELNDKIQTKFYRYQFSSSLIILTIAYFRYRYITTVFPLITPSEELFSNPSEKEGELLDGGGVIGGGRLIKGGE